MLSNDDHPRGLNTYFSTALIVIALGVGIFVLFFRYQYVSSAGETARVDRISGVTCVMPCMPATPKPKAPPSDLQVQRAIVSAKKQPNAELLALSHPETPDERYEWSAVPASSAAHDGSESPDQSTYVVCYCKPDSNGFRWETHLTSGETFFVNDNATLSAKYGITLSTPIPSAEPAIETSDPHTNSTTTPQESVVAFYQAISSKRYSAAYDMLSDSYKKGTGFTQFVSGYRTTQNVEADVNQRDDGSNIVDVVLHATDLRNERLASTTFSGYWKLASDSNGGWKLDAGQFSH